MRKPVLLLAGAAFLLALAGRLCPAQTYNLAHLADDLKQHPLTMRNLTGASTIHAQWTGSDFVLEAASLKSLLPVLIESATIQGHQLHLTGRRVAQLSDGRGGWMLGGSLTPVEILVDAPADWTSDGLSRVKEGLFFPGWSAVLAVTPGWLGGTVAGLGSTYAHGLQNKAEAKCNCSDAGKDACAGKVPSDGIVPPRVLHQEEPKFSQEARDKKIAGSVRYAFIVDEKGRVQDPWVLRPQGSGLDESGYQALIKYRFQPATCHNTVIAVPLQLEINWRLF